MGFNEKMTTLADAIREISGTTTDKTLDNMTSDLDSANAEIAEQAELLEQIATALEGKAAGDGSSGGGSSSDEEPSSPGGTSPGVGSSLPTVSTGLVQSTAEGSVIYAIFENGTISTMQVALSYFSMTQKYRLALGEGILANTPIIVLSSGTITMPSATGYTCETIASGTGYAVYQYVASSDGSEDEDIPLPSPSLE